jgi:hypothetical protein
MQERLGLSILEEWMIVHDRSQMTEAYYLERLGRPRVQLRRFSGGIGWPSKGRPGFMVALAESARPNDDFRDVHDVYVIHEWPSWQGESFLAVPSMLQAMAAVQGRCMIREWVAEPRPEFGTELREFNRKQYASRLPRVKIRELRELYTPEWLAMRVHMRTSGQKTMHFGTSERTRAALSGLGRDLSELTWLAFPEVTALLMALSALDGYPFKPITSRETWTPADGLAGY